jgi:DNA gyrase subunit A
MPSLQTVPLHLATSERYLNYALSVITSRALPDVRDGLKPVQRRILYTMFHELSLRPGGRHRKSAAVVGEVMGKYHPHGDQSIYDALVRMAQDFSLRAPLVEGQGNFGSLDADPAAAMRYTECKLTPLAEELLLELKKRTVDYRDTYDGQRKEPVVLPSQVPHLLINGSEGIAVGMATKIPPHNPGEVIDAAIAMIDKPKITIEELMEHMPAPDFPTGGRILNGVDELRAIYETGQGSIRVQATWEEEKEGRRKQVILTSIPYSQNKAKLIERIGDEVRQRNLPQVVDVRDESTEDVRVVLELKQGASAEAVMAYLFRRTPLQSNWSVNLTALVPSGKENVCAPRRLNLQEILRYWLDFRLETIRRRYTFDLQQLKARIHILEGFKIVFDRLDEAIKLIRESEGKRDAHEKLMEAFGLSDAQTDAILELRLYRLAKLEIQTIVDELNEKRGEASKIEKLLSSERRLWTRVKSELGELRKLYGGTRRTVLGKQDVELAFDEDAYIVAEEAYVVVTRGKWIKRQSSFSSLDKIRVKEDDEIGWLLKANTRSTITFLGSQGSAYTMRVDDIQPTTGYGEPASRRYAFADGEQIVGVLSHDPRHARAVDSEPSGSNDRRATHGVALTRSGRSFRFPLASHSDVSTRNGRKYARLNPGDSVFTVVASSGDEQLCIASKCGRAHTFPVDTLPELQAAGKGVTGIKLRDNDHVFAAALTRQPGGGPKIETEMGREETIRPRKFEGKRGGRGKVLLKRGVLVSWEQGTVVRTNNKTAAGSSKTSASPADVLDEAPADAVSPVAAAVSDTLPPTDEPSVTSEPETSEPPAKAVEVSVSTEEDHEDEDVPTFVEEETPVEPAASEESEAPVVGQGTLFSPFKLED